MGNTIEIIRCTSGDWYIISVNGRLVYEGHSLNVEALKQVVNQVAYCRFTEKEISDEEMEKIT